MVPKNINITLCFIDPCAQTRLPVLEAAKQAHSIMLPCFIVITAWLFLFVLCWRPLPSFVRQSNLVSPDQMTAFKNSPPCFVWIIPWANFGLALMCHRGSNGVLGWRLQRWPQWRALAFILLWHIKSKWRQFSSNILCTHPGFSFPYRTWLLVLCNGATNCHSRHGWSFRNSSIAFLLQMSIYYCITTVKFKCT